MFCLAAAVFAIGAVPLAAQSVEPHLDGFDAYMAEAMKDFKVPGAAVAVVEKGRIILAKGYGFRDVERQLPVTPRTLFAIGSVTKSFTVTTLGMLADEGKVDFDKPVRDYLPGFQMYDPVATEQMTPRDLVTHRSGLPRHDLVWYTSNFSRKELVEKLRYLEPNKPLRSTFQYNNLMFMTAGYLEGVLLDTTWEEAVRRKVLEPLGMTGTNFSVEDSQKGPDFAQPYRKDRKTENVSKIPFYVQGAIGPAGEINTNIEDLSRYLLFHMSKGKLDGKQLLSENNAAQMQTPQMVIQGTPDFKELGEASYGMGFFISTYRGHKQVEHGGNIDGFSAQFAFLPQDQIGVVVLTNLDGTPLRDVVPYYVFDRLLRLEPVPWKERMLERQKKFKQAEQQAENRGFTGQKTGTHPSHELKDYAGDYANPGYGLVTIALDDAASGRDFRVTLNRITKSLRHFHYDIFEVPPNPLDPFEKMKVAFQTDLKGDISSLSMPLETNVKDIVFTRVAEKRMRERSFLEPFTGDYDLFGSTLSVALEGDHTLIATSPGRPKLELVPKHGTMFDIKGRSGESFEFKADASGKVTEAVLYSADDVVVIKKK